MHQASLELLIILPQPAGGEGRGAMTGLTHMCHNAHLCFYTSENVLTSIYVREHQNYLQQ